MVAAAIEPEDLLPYEDKWVAVDTSGDRERVVGSGDTATEAVEKAEAAGCPDAVLFRVPRFDVRHISTPVPPEM